ncbi:MAG TPA: M1 family aminopeptidase [Candidatus Polarisedimenticolia bacterium]|nr:M1 family aminopeptidase [Candidatus Polarisedimenticolia bacterium]
MTLIRVACLGAVILCSVAPRPAPAATLEQTLAGYRNLTVSPQSAVVEQLAFKHGHLELELISGTAAPVSASGKPVGFFFKGKGRLTYVSADPVEIPAMSFNLKRATGLGELRSGAGLAVSDTFTTALILAVGREVPELGGTAAAPLAESFTTHRERFERIADAPASHLFAIRDLDTPDRPVVRVETSGGKEDLVYLFDTVLSRSEWLSSLRKSESADTDLRKYLWPVLLSEQAIDRDRRDPLRSRLDLTQISYTLTASGGSEGTIDAEETFVTRVPQSVLRLDMASNAWTIEGVGSRSVETRSFNVVSVTDQTGAALPFHHENGELVIGLPAPVAEGQILKLKFQITGDFLIHPADNNYWALRPGAWFPQPELAGQRYTVRSIVKAKKPWTPIAPGTLVSRREEGEYNVVESRFDEPVQWTVAVAGNYHLMEETRDGLTIRVASYGGRNEIAMKEMIEVSFRIIDYYQRFLGPFPFKDYTIIQIEDLGWGQAPPGAMFITREAFAFRTSASAGAYLPGLSARIAHEIAHQYWGQVVKMPNFEEQWLTEAFAEYCAALFLRDRVGKVEYNAALAEWKTNAKAVRNVSTIPTANRLATPITPEDAYRKRFYLVYQKGAWLLSRLHAELGDQVFLTFLKSYQKSFRWSFGSTKDVAGLLEFMTKKSYTGFLEENYWGTGMPE